MLEVSCAKGGHTPYLMEHYLLGELWSSHVPYLRGCLHMFHGLLRVVHLEVV